MIKSFLISMFAIFLFTLGAAGAWFYIQMSQEDKPEELVSTLVPEPSPTPTFPGDAIDLPRPIPVGPMTAKDSIRATMGIQTELEKQRRQEERLREERIRMEESKADHEMAQREISGAIDESTGLLKTAEDMLAEMLNLMEQLKQKSRDLADREKAVEQAEKKLGVDAAANTKKFAEYMQSMPPEVVASSLKTMILDNQMDQVVRLLKGMEDRNVSKILAELGDETIVTQIAEAFVDEKIR